MALWLPFVLFYVCVLKSGQRSPLSSLSVYPIPNSICSSCCASLLYFSIFHRMYETNRRTHSILKEKKNNIQRLSCQQEKQKEMPFPPFFIFQWNTTYQGLKLVSFKETMRKGYSPAKVPALVLYSLCRKYPSAIYIGQTIQILYKTKTDTNLISTMAISRNHQENPSIYQVIPLRPP